MRLVWLCGLKERVYRQRYQSYANIEWDWSDCVNIGIRLRVRVRVYKRKCQGYINIEWDWPGCMI